MAGKPQKGKIPPQFLPGYVPKDKRGTGSGSSSSSSSGTKKKGTKKTSS
jgi:hypothetical protein